MTNTEINAAIAAQAADIAASLRKQLAEVRAERDEYRRCYDNVIAELEENVEEAIKQEKEMAGAMTWLRNVCLQRDEARATLRRVRDTLTDTDWIAVQLIEMALIPSSCQEMARELSAAMLRRIGEVQS